MSQTRLPILVLKKDEDRRLRAGHLWVYSNEVDTAKTPLTGFDAGEPAVVQSASGKVLGTACVNPQSLICARLLSRRPGAIVNAAFLERRLRTALALREALFERPYYRLAFGDSDGLPGLVIDRYADVLVIQITTAGMERARDEIIDVIQRMFSPAGILLRNDSAVRELEGLPQESVVLGDVPDCIRLEEGGVHFEVPLGAGQKTGWFYDQRSNRLALHKYVPGLRVLDVFSYAGGFALQAMRAGAATATCIDSSAPSLASAAATAQANGLEVERIEGDAFDTLEALAAERRRFDAVVVDPPAFIKRRKDHPKGLAAYRRVNQLAMQLLDRDGLLMSCSCSHHLLPGELVDAVQRAARHLDRFAQLVAVGAQSPDHPVHPAIDETRYLRAFLFRVTDA